MYWHYICRLIDCFIYVLLLCVYMYVCTCHRLYRSRHLSESHETSSGMLGYARRSSWSPRRSLAASWCLLSLLQLRIRGHCAGVRPDLSCVGSVWTAVSCHRRCAWIVRIQRTSRFAYWLYICRLIDFLMNVLLLCVYVCMYLSSAVSLPPSIGFAWDLFWHDWIG